jgi:THO complex subunit 1
MDLYIQVVLSTIDTQFLGDDYESSSHLDEEDDVMFNIKYLTSSNLMSLEVCDAFSIYGFCL